MIFRQSTLKTWMACPLQAYFKEFAGFPTKAGSKATFGSCIHAALEHYNHTGDLDMSIKLFVESWEDPSLIGLPEIAVWNKFTSYGGLRQRGIEILRTYDDRMRWEQRTVIASEHQFKVPFGKHELTGTIDLISIRQNHKGKQLLVVEDYKTTSRKPTVAELALNIQFCVDEETEALTRHGWVTYDRLVEGDDVLTLDHEHGVAEWQPVLGVHTFQADNQTLLSMEGKGHSSLTTLNHRWPVRHVVSSGSGWHYENRFRTSEQLNASDGISGGAPVVNLPVEAKWKDAFVELVGWFWTEGHWTQTGASLAQSEAMNYLHTARIRACLRAVFGPAVSSLHAERGESGRPAWRETPGSDVVRFYLNAKAAKFLREVVSQEKVVSPRFISTLTSAQLSLFIDTSIDADGTSRNGRRVITQSSRRRLDSMQMACSLAGIRTMLKQYHVGGVGRYAGRAQYRLALMEKRTHFVASAHLQTEVKHTGIVWCPRTANQTWLARRRGSVYFTGNTTYMYALSQPECWFGPKDGSLKPIPNADWWWETLKDIPRRGMWVHLWDNAKELDAGSRDDEDFARLYRLCNEIERAVEHQVYVPNIGDACQLCDFAHDPCPQNPPSRDWWENKRPEEDENSWV